MSVVKDFLTRVRTPASLLIEGEGERKGEGGGVSGAHRRLFAGD